MHSNYQLDAQGTSPYALARGYYESVKKQNPLTIFTSAGDEYEKGAVAEQMTQGLTTRKILFGMQFDVRVLGNHDFGWSEEEVLAESLDPFSQVLSDSIHYAGPNPDSFGAKDFVQTTMGCAKVGFFGMTTWSYDDQDQAQMVNYYPDMPTNLAFLDVAAAQIAAHRKDVDLLIAITHEGVTADGALALNDMGVDIILGGHSHTLIQSIDPSQTNNVPIIQAGAYATDIDRLDVTWDNKQKKITNTVYTVTQLEPETGNVPADPTIQKLVVDTMNTLAPGSQTPMSSLQNGLGDNPSVAMLAANAALQYFSADAAVVDQSTVWNPIAAGPNSPQNYYNAFEVEREPPGTPGFNSFYTASISGAALLASTSVHGWTVVAPQNIDPNKTYLLAGQKRTLNHPTVYLPAGVTLLTTPVAGAEVWEVLTKYAQGKQAACEYVDTGATIQGCTPGK
jgi:2',3'-cyclic-nucleotide 2'-phosphodiesterase (5'-nucleotidase family)